jgi:hypothetical protein
MSKLCPGNLNLVRYLREKSYEIKIPGTQFWKALICPVSMKRRSAKHTRRPRGSRGERERGRVQRGRSRVQREHILQLPSFGSCPGFGPVRIRISLLSRVVTQSYSHQASGLDSFKPLFTPDPTPPPTLTLPNPNPNPTANSDPNPNPNPDPNPNLTLALAPQKADLLEDLNLRADA